MQDFPIRFSIVSDAYSAGRSWLVGESDVGHIEADSPAMDLGNGMRLSASDVVESHFERMVKSSTDSGSETGTEESSDTLTSNPQQLESSASNQLAGNQCAPSGSSDELPSPDDVPLEAKGSSDAQSPTVSSLHRAIGSLAPQLLPLIQLAEELLSANPPVSPKKEFRSLLLAALQAEHKQKVNKMAIGIQKPEPESDAAFWGKVGPKQRILLVAIPIAVVIFLWIRHTRTSIQATEHSQGKR